MKKGPVVADQVHWLNVFCPQRLFCEMVLLWGRADDSKGHTTELGDFWRVPKWNKTKKAPSKRKSKRI